ncbi:e3 ubiquitin-protein ligase HUWE1 [Caerostris darwini]|uniref:E3 ubiquitin-protein ligase TRIP12 n=1 Tax=Caerostris darwini TaxID=1538125 RepID=A0AAV4P512_9ARAC|nr:e3 ubiquitin-protein ligase HUWE1 [Caerostris darwini]
MKIDRTKLKKSASEVPPDCKALIEKLKSCNHDELLEELNKIKTWNCGKCELYHWIDALDAFDYILEISCEKTKENQWCLPCDEPGREKHLTVLLSSSDMNVVLAVLNLLYVFSKRSNFITRLNADKRQTLLLRLLYLAESWGGKENGFGLAECCQNLPASAYPSSASTLHFEYYAESGDEKVLKKATNTIIAIHIDNVDQIPNKTPSQIMEELVEKYSVPEDKQMQLFTHIRLAHSFPDYDKRLLCVQARLQALSVLVYCNAVPENVNSLLYNGLIEELVDVLELQNENLIEIKAAALRTLTSIIHLDRNPKLNAIIDATGAASYHGFLPVLVRSCIQSLTEPESEAFPLPLATALFSFLYHLASYESGGDALVSCGMMEALLKVINWHSTETEHITFVTRAVRVIDLITNLDMQAFQTHGGLASFIQRLEVEVNVCRQEQPFVINPKLNEISTGDTQHLKTSTSLPESQSDMEVDFLSSNRTKEHDNVIASSACEIVESENLNKPLDAKKGIQCFPQRAALLKSMLNFLKKSIQDPAFSDNIRHLMDGSLPNSLKHIISNAEYYGPSLFLLATDVVTVYVFQEPTLLPPLQDSGLTDVVLHALLIKEVPATREVLASLPNVFSALCLNARGLQSFVACKPFEKLFRVLVSPEYLPAMRRRRSSDPIGDAASNLGNAMDELMRHQPSLRTDATAAIIKLLEELCAMGRDPRVICSRPTTKPDIVTTTVITRISNVSNDAGSSDDEEEDDDDTGSTPVQGPIPKSQIDRSNGTELNGSNSSKTAVPLVDYILNVMRFVDAILSNNSTDDHCREFVRQKGLVPLMAILGLPNLPIDFPVTPTCQAISSVCKSILNLAHEPQVLKQGLLHLNEVLQCLEHLHRPVDPPGGSVLLEELVSAPNMNEATLSAQSTPLLHYMSAAHAYIVMFIHVCRTGQSDIRTISISHWGSELGLSVLKGLSSLYTSLVWESTVLLALCSTDSALAEDIQFGRQQLEKLIPKDSKAEKEDEPACSAIEFSSSSVTSVTESSSTCMPSAMDTEDSCHCIMMEDNSNGNQSNGDKSKSKPFSQIKQIKPLLSGASRLGRALAELFGLLVKLCVGSPMRQRRGQQIPPSPSMPSPAARAVATALTRLLAMGLSWEPPPSSPVPKFRLTFYICSVGFTSPMLFDERKYPYHLMLQKFLSCRGLDAFFNTFRWALTCGHKVPIEEGLEHPELPDGTGEFLDAWLMLLEKMVNPKNVLESPHTLPFKINQENATFNPLLFLIHIHKRAFESIMYLWDRKPLLVYGERIAESMLAVICHILKGETIIRERLAKGEEIKVSAPATATTTSPAQASSSSRIVNRGRQVLEGDDSSVNQDHLTQLVDMGFSRSLATEALLNTLSVEQATEYLLNYPSPLGLNSAATESAPALGMDWEMSEEDQMLRAIAMSLGENVLVSSNQVEGEPNKTDEQKEQEFVQQKEEPLSSQVIKKFTEKVIDGCLKLADALPETVYRCCDLLIAVSSRNGENWRNRFLIQRLINEVHAKTANLVKRLNPEQIPVERKGFGLGSKLPWMPVESKFSVRLHLLTLIFEEMKLPCAAAIENKEIISTFISILELTASCLNLLQDEPTPKWLPYLVLIIDQYEKAAVMSKRKAPLLLASKRQWKWFDDRSGKWNNYTLSNNKLIDDAYKAGEASLRFSAGRRNYTVQLTTMVQINEETGNWRPIMLTTEGKEEKEKAKNEQKAKEDTITLDDSSDSSSTDSSVQSVDVSYLYTRPYQIKVIKRLKANQCRNLVRFCVMLMKVPLDPDTLHAVMRLCLRLTRKHCNAVMFAIMEGPKTLLSLTQPYSFIGYTSLTTLLFRHILEDQNTLSHTMEKVIRSATAGGSSSMLVSKEMHYIFRVLGPAACRDSEIFTTVASNTLRMTILPVSKRDDDDSRYNANGSVQMLKSLPTKSNPSQIDYAYDVEVASNLIYDLLNALIAKPVELPEDALETNPEALSANDQPSPLREASTSDLLTNDDEDSLVIPLTIPNVDGFSDSNESINSPRENRMNKDASKDNKSDNSFMKNVPIIRKSGICRILAELVRSYVQCARLIADYSFYADDSELITEDCTALAFILDNLLHNSQTAGDKETPALARVLIAALASCNHSVEAQTTLVNEVRLALLRALSLPESNEKHARIQALTGLISTMIESCPSTSSQNQLGGCALRSQTPMNNIVKILLRKGIVVDLARIPHYLDLSSPLMAATVNSALKPLETLSRIVNMPSGHVGSKTKGKSSAPAVEIRDVVPEAMEEDANARSSVADVTMSYPRNETQAQDMTMDSALAGLMSDIIVHPPRPLRQTSRGTQEINVTVELDTHSNTQTRTRRSASFADHVPDDQHESSDSESNSESGHSHSEDDAERDDRADEAEDEDDDDDDSARFDVRDDYPGVDFFRVQDRDDSLFFQLEEVFPASSGSSVIFGGTDAVRTFQIPVVTEDSNSGNDTPAPTVPPAPRSVTTVHPLLVRHEDSQCNLQPRVHRRQRGYRTNIGGHTWHMYATPNGNSSGRQANPPVILQSSQPSSSMQSRVVFANSDFRILATEDEVFEIQDQTSGLTGDQSGTLSAIPTTLNRWAEESRVLDGDSIHDCVTGLKPSVIKALEAHRDDELVERREKRRKLHDKNSDKNAETIVLSDTETLDGMTNPPEATDHRVTMEVAEPATQFDICQAQQTIRLPDGNIARVSPAIPPPLHHFGELPPPNSTWFHRPITSEQISDLTSFCSITPMDTADGDDREATTSALLEPPSAFHRINPGFDNESPLTSFSTTNVETIDLTETSNDVQDVVMRESSGQNATASSSGVSIQSTIEDALEFLVTAPEERTEDSLEEFTNRGPPALLSREMLNRELLSRGPPELFSRGPPDFTNRSNPDIRSRGQQGFTNRGHPGFANREQPELMNQGPQEFADLEPPEFTNRGPPDYTNQDSNLVNQEPQFDESHPNLAVISSSCERTYVHEMSRGNRILRSRDESSIPVINLCDSPERTEEASETSENPSLDNITSVLENSSYDKNEISDNSTEGPIASNLSEDLANPETDESTSLSNPCDSVIHQPRISTPTLISDDAVPCERPSVNENSTPSDFSNVLGEVEIPEGVDPSFLAALPDNIRQEVIAEQLRLQRLRSRTVTATNESNDESAFTEVNPEFLAALPPNIQEEVLAQQRAEQQRLAAQNSNPDIPVDPTSFIQTLPQGLRQQVLADMDDSLLALLPAELATEAHSLRRELEARHRQIQERFFSSHAGTALSRILRSAGRVGARYTIHSLPHRGQWTWNSLSPRGASSPSGNNAGGIVATSPMSGSVKLRGRYLLDHEALACLLVLLFVDEPQLHTNRLHRVLRNLCHHSPTRTWIVKSLLSILERTKDYQVTETRKDSHRHKRTSKYSSKSTSAKSAASKVDPSNRSGQPSWLSISLDAALGCRTNVFQIRRVTTATRRANERHSLGIQSVLSPNIPLVTIHPLASPVICRHVLDTLISLAKSFPVHFLPVTGKEGKSKESASKGDHKEGKNQPDKKDGKSSAKSDSSRNESDFWDVLVKLDSLSTTSRKGKSALKNQNVVTSFGSTPNSAPEPNLKLGGFQASPLAQLIGLLAHPVVKRSSVLTDRLLRLLALISLALPEPKSALKGKSNSDFRHQITEVQLEAFGITTSLQADNDQKKTRQGSKIQKSNLISEDNEDEETAMKHYLKLAVEVLTSKTCSEEGLEDATALLLRLSRGCIKTRRTVLYLLLDGARQLGQVVCKNIRALMYELRNLNKQLNADKFSEADEREAESEGKFQLKGTIQDRFTSRAVIITAPAKIKSRSGRELQLPSMSSLTSKTSSQAFFLRVLKVIIQLTESTPLLPKNKNAAASDAQEDANVSSTPQSDTLTATNSVSSEVGQALSSIWDLELMSPTSKSKLPDMQKDFPSLHLSSQLMLEELWTALSDCLKELAETPDHHAVLVLQPAVEAFFLVHASLEKEIKKKDRRRDAQESEVSHLQDLPPASPLSSLNSCSDQSNLNTIVDCPVTMNLSLDTVKFLKFAETHRTVLNQILRQSTTPLADGPFSVLVDHTRVLDFDVKRRYFRQELERMDEGSRREDLAVHVRREHVFEDSFRELHRRSPEEWKNRFYIVFEGEEGQDAGGLLREWYTIISREIFNPMYALFTTSPGDRVTYMINSSSHCNSNHLSYFKFVGRVIAKAVYDNKLLESYFTRSFYKHILGKNVKYTDMESEDYSFYQGLVFLLEHGVNELGYELTFSVEVQEFGVTEVRDLRPNGRNLPVTEENKNEYVKLVCQEKMTGAIRKQLKAFLEGFYEIIPKRLISIFNEQELELLISGLPNIDIDDLKANTEYHKYQTNSLQIQWFWRALRSFDQADRANFLQFVTGTSKVPLQGFAALEGMNGTQKFQIHRDDRSTDRLPSAHTCFNQLDLPAYETYDKLRSMLLKAIHECSEGFGFA